MYLNRAKGICSSSEHFSYEVEIYYVHYKIDYFFLRGLSRTLIYVTIQSESMMNRVKFTMERADIIRCVAEASIRSGLIRRRVTILINTNTS